jgi:hypothetical protein
MKTNFTPLRALRFGALALPAILLGVLQSAGCRDAGSATDPAQTTTSASSALLTDATITPRDEVVLFLDNTLFIACANENIRFFGDVVFWNHFTETASGIVVIHTTLPGAPFTPPFLAVGQSSGTVWAFERNTVTTTNVLRDGTGQVFHISDSETYVSDEGDVLKLRSTFHITVNPDHTLVIAHGGWTCG